jgi:hypothetical protein
MPSRDQPTELTYVEQHCALYNNRQGKREHHSGSWQWPTDHTFLCIYTSKKKERGDFQVKNVNSLISTDPIRKYLILLSAHVSSGVYSQKKKMSLLGTIQKFHF